jgi:hypothetical protein
MNEATPAIMMTHQASYFMHIPKTAGTSLMAALERQYPAAAVCPDKLWHQLALRPQPDPALEHYALFQGHFYGMLAGFIGCPLRTFTILRDPLERALSHYAHVRREPQHYLHVRANQLDGLEAFILDKHTRPMISDFQVRALAMNFDMRRLIAGLPEESIRQLVIEQQIETWLPAAAERETLLARAKAALDEMVVVGLTERYGDSLRLLDRSFGWALSTHQPDRLNVTSQRERHVQLTAAQLDLLGAANTLDQALYDYAVARFNVDFRAMEAEEA